MTRDANGPAEVRPLPEEVRALNVGLPLFGDAVRAQGVPAVDLDWRVPAGGDPDLVSVLTRLHGRHAERVERANAEVLRRLDEGAPVLKGIATAGSVVPAMTERMLLHPGPPLQWESFTDPLRRSVRAAVVAEGWAADGSEAERLVDDGEVELDSATTHATVLPMATTLGPSAPVWVAENPQGGNRAFAPISQGPGRTQWMGVDAAEASDQLRWLRDVAAPVLDGAVQAVEEVDILALAAQGLQMGDDLHTRLQGASGQFLRHLVPALAGSDDPRRGEVAGFLSSNYLFFLTVGMAAAKAVVDWADEIEGSSIVTAMSRNATTFGVRVSGQSQWSVAEAPPVKEALYRHGYGPEHGAPDIGDSAVLELIGLGGPAAAASPAIAGFLGGGFDLALSRTREIGLICAGRSSRFRVPYLDYEGTPLGVDARLSVELETTPAITTGILHAQEGVGQIGAGVARAPLPCFQESVRHLDRTLAA